MPRELTWPLGPLANGVLLGAFAAGLALALAIPDGLVTRWMSDGMRGALGHAAYALPLLVGWLALAAWHPTFLDPDRVCKRALIAQATALSLFSALLQSATGDPLPSWGGGGGGAIGWVLLGASVSLLGPTNGAIALASLLLVAMWGATGIGPAQIGHLFVRGAADLGRRLTTESPRFRTPPIPPSITREPRDEAPRILAASAAAATLQLQLAAIPDPEPPDARTRNWVRPPLTLLAKGLRGELTQTCIEQKATSIEEALAEFDVFARVVEVNPGPTVTQFGLRPGYRERRDRAGNVTRRDKIKVSEIVGLQNDLALALAAPSIRIEAPVPGRQLVGIEVPNGATGIVALRDLMESERFAALSARARLAVALGQDVSSHVVCADLARMPHLLIAGATGSGKSVCVNSIIASLLLRCSPEDLRLLMIDPKRVELTGYNGIPHLLRPVVTEVDKVVSVLRWVTHEMDERYRAFERIGCRNIDAYRRSQAARPDLVPMPYLVVIIDELADIMLMAADEVEPALCRLAQMARATGIHLVVATQRPSVDVITGLIKANFPTRIAFAVTSQVDSRTILDAVGAEKLLGRGDMLFLAADAPKPQRLQGTWVADHEIDAIVAHWQEQGEPSYIEELVNAQAWTSDDGGADQDLYDRALEVARGHTRLSTSLLQRRLRIGYPRAARLIEVLEERGIVGPADGGGRSREVLLPPDDQTDDDVVSGRIGEGVTSRG